MKKVGTLILMVLGIVVFFSPMALCGEVEILQALEDVKAGIEEGLSQEELTQLLHAAWLKVDAMNKAVGNTCFRASVRRCYDWYAQWVSSRGSLIENVEQRDKYWRQAEYGEARLKDASLTIAENYDKLIRHAQGGLPSKRAQGDASLLKAQACLETEK
jgi:hypothetical protein